MKQCGTCLTSTSEKAAFLCGRLLVTEFGVGPQDLFLFLREVRRHGYTDVNEQVSPATPLEAGHALLGEAIYRFRLGTGRQVDGLRVSVDDGDFDRRAEHGFADP